MATIALRSGALTNSQEASGLRISCTSPVWGVFDPRTSQDEAVLYGEFDSSDWAVRTCRACSAGSATGQSGTGATMCVACASGHYSDEASNVACKPCAAGTCASADATQCIACEPGKYSDDAASQCETCGAGSVISGGFGTIQDSCNACPAGHHSAADSFALYVAGTGTWNRVAEVVAVLDNTDVHLNDNIVATLASGQRWTSATSAVNNFDRIVASGPVYGAVLTSDPAGATSPPTTTAAGPVIPEAVRGGRFSWPALGAAGAPVLHTRAP